jgi:hypothetical protein
VVVVVGVVVFVVVLGTAAVVVVVVSVGKLCLLCIRYKAPKAYQNPENPAPGK